MPVEFAQRIALARLESSKFDICFDAATTRP
jgi:hypothetical protein